MMDINEIKAMKEKLQLSMKAQIDEFERLTGTVIERIYVEHIYYSKVSEIASSNLLSRVSIELERL